MTSALRLLVGSTEPVWIVTSPLSALANPAGAALTAASRSTNALPILAKTEDPVKMLKETTIAAVFRDSPERTASIQSIFAGAILAKTVALVPTAWRASNVNADPVILEFNARSILTNVWTILAIQLERTVA